MNENRKISWFRELARKGGNKISDVECIINWLENARSNTLFRSELVSLNEINGWEIDGLTGNIYHESGHFFSIHGARTLAAGIREVNSWDQPILNQKEGGVLALFSCYENYNIKFLLNAKAEPGNIGGLQLTPTIQCTWSNLNQAHKGKLPPLSEYVLKENSSTLIYEAHHNEEGGRFWKKSNSNRIYYFDDSSNIKFDKNKFIWVTFDQVKELALIDNVLSPFVKTIISPI